MKKINYLYTFLSILPLIDLITSITSRYFPNFISIGAILKGLILLIGVFYIFFYSASKYKKMSIIYITILVFYVLGYFIFKSDLIDKSYFFSELNYLIKLSFFPTMFVVFLNLFDDFGFDIKKIEKVMIINIIFYILFIIGPTILNFNFSSYSSNAYFGSVGWFYSANEISSILLFLFPFIYKFMSKDKLILIILFLLALYMISFIGTKVTLFGIIIMSIILMLMVLFKSKNNLNRIIAIILTFITIGFMHNNYAFLNMKASIGYENNQNAVIDDNPDIVDKDLEEELNDIKEEKESYKKWQKFSLSLLSDRDIYAIYTYRLYRKNFEPSYFLFGMGISNTSRINDKQVAKLIEIDFLDIFFHFGLLALLITIYPFIYTIICIVKSKTFNHKILLFSLTVLLMIGVSSLAGHVLLAPAVSIYLCLYLICIINETHSFKRKDIKKNKVTILAMHLGYGGVENAICNIASNLVDNYDVEIISLYKNKEKIPFKLAKKVKVTYLLNTISNRQEFKNALKDFDLTNLLKEGFKALKIISKKDNLIKKAIINCDAKIIISTRIKYSNLLNEYGNDLAIKIHQEHTYSVGDKYINHLNKLDNINYIMPVSNVLYNEYKNKVTIPLKYIPLALNYYPSDDEISKLNNYNLIAIGRLEPEKGFDDLLDVVYHLTKENKKIKLNIFGDGSLRESLQDKINHLKLENNITLWGFKEYDFIKKYLIDSALYVMTSYEESFGLVVLEAMSYGVPCVTYASAKGVKSIVNNKNGFIINKRDNKKMAKVILDYFNLKSADKRKYGTEARKISYEYSNEAIKEQWLDFLDSINE